MGVIGKQRDQGEEQGGKNRDPALTVKSQNHRSQPNPDHRLVQANYQSIRGITGQSCCGAIARSLIEPEGFEGE